VTFDPQAAIAGHLAVQENYGTPQPLPVAALHAMSDRGSLPLPDGWSLQSGYETTLQVTIVDQGGTASTVLPVVHANLSRGAEALEVQVAAIEDSTARSWADYLAVAGTLVPVSGGRGFASGKGIFIDRGTLVIRVTYDGGTYAQQDPAAVSAKTHSILTTFS
jgi:hypothetical protein